MHAQLVVLSGGSHSGKTTLLGILGQRGFLTVPESALEVINALNRELGGVEQQIEWRNSHGQDFQERLVRRQVELECAAAASDGVVFLDRCQIDSIAYCRLRNLALPPALQINSLTKRYAAVFILDTLSNYDIREETGRMSTRDLSIQVRDLLFAAYREFGYEPILIPELPIQQRVEMVLSHLGNLLGLEGS